MKEKLVQFGLRAPYSDMRIFILDANGRYERDGAVDEIGNICIKGKHIFKGFLEEEHNRGIWPRKGYYNTGDLGRKDTDGCFWLTGRKKELIIRGGHNIDPKMIEEPLYRLAGVTMAAAVGRPDPKTGEMPIAYVQLTDDSNLTENDIVNYLKETVEERAAIPKEVIIIKEIAIDYCWQNI